MQNTKLLIYFNVENSHFTIKVQLPRCNNKSYKNGRACTISIMYTKTQSFHSVAALTQQLMFMRVLSGSLSSHLTVDHGFSWLRLARAQNKVQIVSRVHCIIHVRVGWEHHLCNKIFGTRLITSFYFYRWGINEYLAQFFLLDFE